MPSGASADQGAHYPAGRGTRGDIQAITLSLTGVNIEMTPGPVQAQWQSGANQFKTSEDHDAERQSQVSEFSTLQATLICRSLK